MARRARGGAPMKRARVVLIIIGAVVLTNVALYVLSRLTGGEPGGPPSSTYSTGGQGLAAYADLLSRDGHVITRLRRAIADEAIPDDATLFVLDAQIGPGDAGALAGFVAHGGHLVIAGVPPTFLERIAPDPPSIVQVPVFDAMPEAPVPE